MLSKVTPQGEAMLRTATHPCPETSVTNRATQDRIERKYKYSFIAGCWVVIKLNKDTKPRAESAAVTSMNGNFQYYPPVSSGGGVGTASALLRRGSSILAYHGLRYP